MKTGLTLLLCGILIIACAVCGCSGPAWAPSADSTGSTAIPSGSGQFVFNDLLGNSDRPIIIYTYRPASWDRSGPVLIVMPGAGRIGIGSRDTWIPYSEKYSSLLVVPEFSEQYYPGDLWYAGGNLVDADGHWNPRSNWTYTAIEHLFDEIRWRSGATRNTYLLFGHSAGAQFVHRLVTFLPHSRYSRAVAANAGLYVFPVYTVQYPFGLRDSPLPEGDLPTVFARKLIVMSGADDTNPNDSSRANFPEAEVQGSTRFERARLYITTARAEAARINATLEWEYSVVMGVGHSESEMAGPSARRLFGGT